MQIVYEVAIVIWVVFMFWLVIECNGGWSSFRSPKNDYERKQREIQKRRDIEQVKAQDEYDNYWGYIK